MAKQTVPLEPGESKVITFETIPLEAKTYQLSVDGLTGSFRAIEVPVVGWISPTSHSDPDEEWTREEEAYDGNTATSARAWTPVMGWGGFLYLNVNETYINEIRFWTHYIAGLIEKIDVDVFYEGAWHHVYEGDYRRWQWVEKSIPAGTKLVSGARVRYYNHSVWPESTVLYEFEFGAF